MSTELALDQLPALSCVIETPPPPVPANRSVPFSASERTMRLVNPALPGVQLVPPLFETNTPSPFVPANRFGPLCVSEKMKALVNPELTDVQCAPLSLDRKTPPLVPANSVVPRTASARTMVFVNPLLTRAQLRASSVDTNTPAPFVPAKRLVDSRERKDDGVGVEARVERRPRCAAIGQTEHTTGRAGENPGRRPPRAREHSGSPSRALTAVQLFPRSVERKTPPPPVPA